MILKILGRASHSLKYLLFFLFSPVSALTHLVPLSLAFSISKILSCIYIFLFRGSVTSIQRGPSGQNFYRWLHSWSGVWGRGTVMWYRICFRAKAMDRENTPKWMQQRTWRQEEIRKDAQLNLISKHLSNIYYSQGTEAITLKPSNGFIFSWTHSSLQN